MFSGEKNRASFCRVTVTERNPTTTHRMQTIENAGCPTVFPATVEKKGPKNHTLKGVLCVHIARTCLYVLHTGV